jgi:hypothetical protein
MDDLELGMPRDMVLAGLTANYKLKEVTSPPRDPKDLDVWQVFRSGNVYVGDVFFREGKLELASIVLYDSEAGADESKMVNRLFQVIYDQSGKSSIEEEPGIGMLKRTRAAPVVVESTEETLGDKLKIRTLRFIVGQKQFNLSVSTKVEGEGRFVELTEVIKKRWQAGR